MSDETRGWFPVDGGMQAKRDGLHLFASHYGAWVLVGANLVEIERGQVAGVERTQRGLVEAQAACEAAAERHRGAR